MRLVTLELRQCRRRRWLTGIAVGLGSALVLGSGLGVAGGLLPRPVLFAGILGGLVALWLVYALHWPHAAFLARHGHAEPASVPRAFTLLGLQIGVLTSLALTVLFWIMELKQ
ncbi:MAG: hypothetical protein KKB13_00170 [Chloroflexi bacterium]|nr:hypothetical protein [Chloroflexota bacterium]